MLTFFLERMPSFGIHILVLSLLFTLITAKGRLVCYTSLRSFQYWSSAISYRPYAFSGGGVLVFIRSDLAALRLLA